DLNVGDMISVSANSMQASAGNGLIDIGETVFSKKISDRNQSDNGGNANSSETQTEDNESNLNDISLSSLIVKNAVITPDFSPQIKNYEATVPFEIEELEVEAVAANENAKVTISDTKLIYVGTNITRIVVEAENGSKRTYKITTTREDRIKSDTPETEKTAGMPVWGIVLIIVGAVILLAVIVIAILLIVKSKRRNQ
ncbi:MAG: cadherin-like beta sandwich domain-containing protein, partial [Oscillospiraceae bacterium]